MFQASSWVWSFAGPLLDLLSAVHSLTMDRGDGLFLRSGLHGPVHCLQRLCAFQVHRQAQQTCTVHIFYLEFRHQALHGALFCVALWLLGLLQVSFLCRDACCCLHSFLL